MDIGFVEAMQAEIVKAGTTAEKIELMKMLTDYVNAQKNSTATTISTEPEEDHNDALGLGLKLSTLIGDDIIFNEGNLWNYNGVVWKHWNERNLESWVQKNARKVDGGGITVSKLAAYRRTIITDKNRESIKWDNGDKAVVNALNGEIHFKDNTWVLEPHNKEAFRTSNINVEFDPTATAPVFDKFLDGMFQGDADIADKRKVMLEGLGYSLMTHTAYNKFFLLKGSGSNGKSIFLETLQAIVGKGNYTNVNPAELNKGPQMAELMGKLINVAPDLNKGDVLADGPLKQVSSGDSQTADMKFGHPFQFNPYATIWMSSNHMPFVKDHSHGFRRRAIVVKLNRIYTEAEKDDSIAPGVLKELPGILNMALDAYANVVRTGRFTMPASSENALREWMLESNSVEKFIDESFTVTSANDKIELQSVFTDYLDWCADENVKHTVKKSEFKSRVIEVERNIIKVEPGAGNRVHVFGLKHKAGSQVGIVPTFDVVPVTDDKLF